MSEEPPRRRVQRGPMGPGSMGPTEKPKEFKNTWMKLIRYSKKYLPHVAVAMVMAGIAAGLTVYCPDLMGRFVDEIVRGIGAPLDMSFIISIGTLLVVLYVISALLNFIQHWIMAKVTAKISKQLRTSMSGKINRLPFKFFNKTSYGEVLSRMTNDIDTIGTTLNQTVTTLITAGATFAGVLIMMFITNWTMALTAAGASVLGFLMMAVIVKKSQKYFAAQQKGLGEVNGHVEEIYTGHTIVKVYNGSKGSKKTFEDINGRLYNSAWKSLFFSGLMMPLMMFVGNFGYVAVCIVGATLAFNNVITFGVIVSFIIYARMFTQPLAQLAQAASSLQRTAAAGERVFEFLEENELEDESQKVRTLTNVKGDVEFRNVRFGYTPEKTVIKDFSTMVKAGQKIAIVGPTGAGKTTLVNLLMRFYELDSGMILIDGVPIDEVRRENVHEQFCMVLQDTWLFEGTIKENIIFSKPGVSDDEVVAACTIVGLDRFVQTLPDGYDTVLNDKANLSEGQKQLLTIARAIIKDAPLLILDEATSSVDTRTERLVQDAMDMVAIGRTSFIIAHRLSTIKNADKILVLKDGDIVESGTHKDLLAQRGFYAELYNSQFETA
jgi:ATP-binding cassette subfamily B protein